MAGCSALSDVSLARRRGAVRRHRRAQRRRQDHAVQGDLRHGGTAQAAHPVRGPRSAGGAAGAARASRHRACAGGTAGVHEHDRPRESRDGRLSRRRARSRGRAICERILALFPVLADRRSQLAGTLSGGEQQMLAIGRGIASSPRLLMLDEPSMGLAPTVADLIFERIEEIHRRGRADGPAGRAACRRGAAILRCGLRARNRACRAEGPQRGAACRRPRARAYLGM